MNVTIKTIIQRDRRPPGDGFMRATWVCGKRKCRARDPHGTAAPAGVAAKTRLEFHAPLVTLRYKGSGSIDEAGNLACMAVIPLTSLYNTVTFAFLWILGLAALFISYRWRLSLGRAGVTQGPRAILAKNLTEVFAVYVAAGSLFLGVLLWAAIVGLSDPTLQTLWNCERELQQISDVVGRFRVPAAASAAILLTAAIVARRLSSRLPERLYGWFQRYQKAMRRVTLAATAVASYSLFAGVLDSGRAIVSAHIRTVSESYKIYVSELESAANQAATARLLQAISNNLPPAWRAILTRNDAIWESSRELRALIDTLQAKHSLTINLKKGTREANAPGRAEAPRAAEPVDVSPREAAPEAASTAPREAGRFSENRLAELRSSLRDRMKNVAKEAQDFLNTPLGSEVPDSLLGALLSHTHWEALIAAGKQSPLLEALLGVLDKAVADQAASRLKQTIFRLAHDPQVRDPGDELWRAADADPKTLDWTAAALGLARADRRTRVELMEVVDALASCRDIERQAIAREQEGVEAREELLRLKWQVLVTEFDSSRIDFGGIAADPGDSQPKEPITRPGPVPRKRSKPFPGVRQLFFSIENLRAAMDDFLQSERKAPESLRTQMLGQAEATLAATESIQEKAERLRELEAEPKRQELRARDNAFNHELFGSRADEFGSMWENARESQERLERLKLQKEELRRRIEEESFKRYRESILRLEEECDCQINEFEDIDGVSGIEIGRFKLPRIPLRVFLRAFREIKVP